MRLIVVRHGIAKAKRSWKGQDDDRPLTVGGLGQAEAISRRLVRYRPTRIVSSPSLRCTQTVEPLVAASGVQMELSNALATDGGSAGVEFALHTVQFEPDTSTVVFCTHRELMIELLPRLARREGVTIRHRLPGAKGGCWSLLYRKGRLTSVKYWPAGR